MSDNALTVPAAGWYPDRNDATIIRWWDGSQWTDHTRQIETTAAGPVEQPVSAAAFGLGPSAEVVGESVHVPAAAPSWIAPANAPIVSRSAAVPAGWYPDSVDRSLQRWWDGSQWTAHTAPLALRSSPGASTAGAYTAGATAPAVNSLATRGLIYSLIALVINPFFMMSIGGFVNGIRAYRRVPQFSPENSRRGSAIAAIAVGAFSTVVSILLVVVAITTAVGQANRPHVFDRVGAEHDIRSQLNSSKSSSDQTATSVSCPPDLAMKAGDTFDCTAVLDDGETLPIHIVINHDGGAWTYTWRADSSESSGNTTDTTGTSETTDPSDGMHQLILDITNGMQVNYGTVSSVDCPAGASVSAGADFECGVSFADGRTAVVSVSIGDDLSEDIRIVTPPAGSGSSSQSSYS